jgi:hypothetical protein
LNFFKKKIQSHLSFVDDISRKKMIILLSVVFGASVPTIRKQEKSDFRA